MSGIEIAGLVLGALPLAIQALEIYRSTLSSMRTRSVTRDLEFMIRDLGTEQQILQNTCETLLQGIVPDSLIDAMIDNPFGPDWKTFDDQLRLRLWRSCGQFQLKVTEMQVAVQELQEKLSIQADGKTKLLDRRSILAELKRNTAFTLKKKDYDGILSRIKDGNSILLRLVQQNNNLEPSRRFRSHAEVARLIRRLSSGIFNAMQSALTCRCTPKHNIGLELVPRNATHKKGARTVKFDLGKGSPRAMETMVQVSAGITGLTATPAYDPQPVTDLCLFAAQKQPYTDCCGFITDVQDRFKIYEQLYGQESRVVTLRHVLEDRDQTLPPFGYPEKLRLALALSASVLDLYSTPWLASIVTLDDIVFLRGDASQAPMYSPYRPFVAKAVLESPGSRPQAFRTGAATRPMDLTLLSLGTLLIQIIVGRPIDAIDMVGDDMSIDSVLGRQAAASQLTGQVMQSGGMSYDAAVRWCLDSILGVASLEDDGFCQSFHEAVVSRLETDVKLALGDT
ncbi:hypothetical protein F5883DRAFT_400437 [Diaporthe sp. PMI_573]|nr:hypothetical protein F5883DRAFT_400437 [Diaporthaceae sp. PMI_573]